MKKKQTNDQKIIAAMDAVDKSVRNLRKYGSKYDTYIDEAAIHGKDARARQLIKQKIRVYSLAEMLQSLKTNIELGAFTAHALSELGKLPEAILGCKGLLAESPDFTKLGKSIESIFGDIAKSEKELEKLNDILSPAPVESISSRLNDMPDEEMDDQFKAEYNAMLIRVGEKTATENIATPKENNVTGDLDIGEAIFEENKKH